jgi:hypothetical protein
MASTIEAMIHSAIETPKDRTPMQRQQAGIDRAQGRGERLVLTAEQKVEHMRAAVIDAVEGIHEVHAPGHVERAKLGLADCRPAISATAPRSPGDGPRAPDGRFDAHDRAPPGVALATRERQPRQSGRRDWGQPRRPMGG